MKCSSCRRDVSRKVRPGTETLSRPVYEDNEGKRWNGHQCSKCKNASKTLIQKPTRKCRKCASKLPPTRYFECETCLPELEVDTGDLIYFD